MINREHIPTVGFLNIADRVKQLLRVRHITDARVLVHIRQGIDLKGAPPLTADETAHFVRRLTARLCDQLLDL